MSTVQEAWDTFKDAWAKLPAGAHGRSATEKKQVAVLLASVITAAGKKSIDIANAGIADRMTVEQRWLKGVNLPSRPQMALLEQFLAPCSVANQSGVLAVTLNDPRIQHVLELIVEERAAGREIETMLLEKLVRWGLEMYCNSYAANGRVIPLDWLRYTIDSERRFAQ